MTTDEFLNDIAYGTTRDDAAKLYAAAIRYGWPLDWQTVNAAIIERWSKSGLLYVKREAWKLNYRLAVGEEPHDACGCPRCQERLLRGAAAGGAEGDTA